MGIRLNLKLGHSLQPSCSSNSSPKIFSYSFKVVDAPHDSARTFFPSVMHGHNETSYNDLLRAHTCLSAPQTFENDYDGAEQIKTKISRGSLNSSYDTIYEDGEVSIEEDENTLRFLASLQATKAQRFRLLMENLNSLEDTFADLDVVRLERDILMQFQRLGALKLFDACLSRTFKSSPSFDLYDVQTEPIEKTLENDPVNAIMHKVVVRSGKRQERRSRRNKASERGDNLKSEFCMGNISEHPLHSKFSSTRRTKNSRLKRVKTARNEAEMSKGIKLIAGLERIRTKLEEESGEVASLSIWAKAAGIEMKVLQQHLHFGWYCRDELLRNTRALIVYIAKSYGGLGVAFEDLIQAGNLGVLQGAERFDHTRGYKFSTYVQYWIRKSILIFVTRHARGIRVPCTLSKAINQIQKARKAFRSNHNKCPDDSEIAKFTGLSMAKIMSARRCLRVVGSIDQKIGDCINAKFLELTPDLTMRSTEEIVMRQHMVNDIHTLLKGLEPRERQVLILRFGLGGDRCKSLEEIGRHFGVSKEWIRRIEGRALTKLRNKDTLQDLSHYLYI